MKASFLAKGGSAHGLALVAAVALTFGEHQANHSVAREFRAGECHPHVALRGVSERPLALMRPSRVCEGQWRGLVRGTGRTLAIR